MYDKKLQAFSRHTVKRKEFRICFPPNDIISLQESGCEYNVPTFEALKHEK